MNRTIKIVLFGIGAFIGVCALVGFVAGLASTPTTKNVAGSPRSVEVDGPTQTDTVQVPGPTKTVTAPAPAPKTVTRTVAPPKPKAPPAPKPPAPFTGTTYTVTSDGGINSVTYSMPNFSQAQDTEVSGNSWTKKVDGVDYPSLVAQNAGGGTISCTITDNGQQLDHETSHGQYAVVTCNGG